MSKTNKRAAPPARDATSKTNKRNHTTGTARAASGRKHLTPEQRGRFWQSVGDLIVTAERRAAK